MACTLHLKRDKIVDFLSANVSAGTLGDKLFEAGLISDDIRLGGCVSRAHRSQKIGPMIDAVIARIELNEENYEKFKSVLKDFGFYDLIEFIEH